MVGAETEPVVVVVVDDVVTTGATLAAHKRQCRSKRFRPGDILADKRRDEEIAQDVPGGAGRLIAVARIVGGYALSPTDQTFGVDGHQQAVALLLRPKAGDERADKPHANVIEINPFNIHNVRNPDESIDSSCVGCRVRPHG